VKHLNFFDHRIKTSNGNNKMDKIAIHLTASFQRQPA